jgi:uncharacterized protein (TIGR00730 family)
VRAIGVFCGSSPGNDPLYRAAATQLGIELARRRLTLVFGGGNVGLMRCIADAVMDHGGRAIGIMPRHLVDREIGHQGISELRVVDSMHRRKQEIADLADAFVLLPGGFGSWEEFCEAVTWAQLGLHEKPCGILKTLAYYDPLLSLVERAAKDGFIRQSHLGALVTEGEPSLLLDRLEAGPKTMEVKWTTASTK